MAKSIRSKIHLLRLCIGTRKCHAQLFVADVLPELAYGRTISLKAGAPVLVVKISRTGQLIIDKVVSSAAILRIMLLMIA